jgi:hypothetical protein
MSENMIKAIKEKVQLLELAFKQQGGKVKMNLNFKVVEQPDIKNIFLRERSDLSTRAINILKVLKIFDFSRFMDFMAKNKNL